jgi:diguanylate cyclase (GGDEF)-like protein/PAS domain S-box-containing protein
MDGTRAPPLHPLSASPVVREPRGLRHAVWLVVLAVACLLGLAYYGIHLLAAARAYVAGESAWSKAQKEAVYRLQRYSLTRDLTDWRAFQAELQVYQGDRAARLEMDQRKPDLARVHAAFLQGRNHPEDIGGMVHLYRNFGWTTPVREAVGLWSRGDVLMDSVLATGDRIHTLVQAGVPDSRALTRELDVLAQANAELAPLEARFSAALVEAAHGARRLLVGALVLLAMALVLCIAVIARRSAEQTNRLRRALTRGERQLRSLIQMAPMPLAIVRTVDNTFLYANNRALSLFKLRQTQVGTVPPRDLYYRPGDRDRFWSALLLDGRLQDFELQLQDVDGQPFWALVSAERVEYGGADCVLIAVNNIEERRRAQDALRYRAFHDELTGLPNRAMFMDSLKRTMSRLDRRGSSCSILFIDLDHFKEVNDTWGHAAGDVLLQQVAQRIRHAVREGDLVARLGGDEFVVLIEEATSPEELSAIAQNLIEALGRPCELSSEVLVRVTSSIGISTYPRHGRDLESLVQHADRAMYRAKAEGRNNFQFSEPGELT